MRRMCCARISEAAWRVTSKRSSTRTPLQLAMRSSSVVGAGIASLRARKPQRGYAATLLTTHQPPNIASKLTETGKDAPGDGRRSLPRPQSPRVNLRFFSSESEGHVPSQAAEAARRGRQYTCWHEDKTSRRNCAPCRGGGNRDGPRRLQRPDERRRASVGCKQGRRGRAGGRRTRRWNLRRAGDWTFLHRGSMQRTLPARRRLPLVRWRQPPLCAKRRMYGELHRVQRHRKRRFAHRMLRMRSESPEPNRHVPA
jgi:hypothetical protein